MINKKNIAELNESIKDYNEEILINQNEYRKPYEIKMNVEILKKEYKLGEC